MLGRRCARASRGRARGKTDPAAPLPRTCGTQAVALPRSPECVVKLIALAECVGVTRPIGARPVYVTVSVL